MSGGGHIRRRGKNSWELKFDVGRDETSNKRITKFHSFKGSRKDAQFKLAELIDSIGKGSYVSRSRLTVAEHVSGRINQWESLGKISPKRAERYRELNDNQITPHLGSKPLQKLKPVDIENWHADLKVKGRKDGAAGLSARTIQHAHRLLSKSLSDAQRHELLVRNVAALQSPPKLYEGDDEVVILNDEQVKMAVEKLRGRRMYTRAIAVLFTGLRRGDQPAAWPCFAYHYAQDLRPSFQKT